MTTPSTLTAGRLRAGDLLVDGAVLRKVESVRLQGAPAEAVVELHGLPTRRHYRVDATVQVVPPAA
jgi:hypothetical protein